MPQPFGDLHPSHYMASMLQSRQPLKWILQKQHQHNTPASQGPVTPFGDKKSRKQSLSSTWEKTDSSDVSDDEDEQHDLDVEMDIVRPSNGRRRSEGDEETQQDSVNNFLSCQMASISLAQDNQEECKDEEDEHEAKLRGLNPSNQVEITACFGKGWTRGKPAQVRWRVLDDNVKTVRIDVCNVSWLDVPPTIMTHSVPNSGHFEWRKVVWGLPIKSGYFVCIYEVLGDDKLKLLGTSERFAVVQ